MTNEPDVPTLAEIWDFLVGLKDTTEAGFSRLTDDLTRVEQSLRAEFQSGLSRVERRLAHIESMNVDRRLDDHERRIVRLEQGRK